MQTEKSGLSERVSWEINDRLRVSHFQTRGGESAEEDASDGRLLKILNRSQVKRENRGRLGSTRKNLSGQQIQTGVFHPRNLGGCKILFERHTEKHHK